MHIAVIGAGMIGAAAARHLALQGQTVTLIGPDEPADPATHTGVFASHYDEGRITRSLDPHPFWSRAGRESIAQYDQIARTGGVAFYTQVGAAIAGPKGSPAMTMLAETVAAQGVDCTQLDQAARQRRFPYFAFADDDDLMLESTGAGYISARRMVAAQINAAQTHGAARLVTEVQGLDEDAQGVTIRHNAGSTRADRVLVAAGAFTNSVLPQPLDLSVRARTVVMMELDGAEADRLADMPSLIWMAADGYHAYMLPPIRYPNGKTYLKTGGDRVNNLLHGRDAICDWFRSGGDAELGADLLAQTHARIPGLSVQHSFTVACMTTFGPNGFPQIGAVSDRVFVATAGCGKAAKSSDALGRLGAEVTLGQGLPDWAACAAIA